MNAPPGHDGHTTSIWMGTTTMPDASPLAEDLDVDVCIVGAGVAGLSVAYELGRLGQRVAVIDAGAIGGSQTLRTTAHLASALDDRFMHLERLHGAKGAKLAAESHAAAIDRIEAICQRELIDCDFARVDGYLFAGPEHDVEYLRRERDAALRAGLAVVEEPGVPLPFDAGPCLRFPKQAMIHPGRYMAGLCQAVLSNGGHVYPGTRATEVTGGKEARVRTDRGFDITARAIVVATNVPINDVAVIHTKQAAYRSYAIAVELEGGARVHPALFWDTSDPYHYVRPARSRGSDVLIVGGEDHKTGQEPHPEQRWERLLAWTRERFGPVREVHRWSGQVIEPADGLAFIGKNPADADNVFIVTGDSGHGMTHGAIAGMLLGDLVLGHANAWSTLYDPRRRTLRAAADYAKENLNVAAQYTDWLKPGEVDSVDQIPRGEGALIRRGTSLLAVHVGEEGVVTACSAACTHLGGVVHWNRAEKTWDCPCHGARYAATGEVVEGPAISALERVTLPDGVEGMTPVRVEDEEAEVAGPGTPVVVT